MSAPPNPLLPLQDVGTEPVDCLIIAGEHSGDQHAARMVKRAWKENPSLRLVAVGGPALHKASVPVLSDLTQLSVVGLIEVLKHYRLFKAFFDELLAWVETHRPRAICYVDYPGFNLRFAKALTEKGLACQGGGSIKQLYYISPQIWAWKAKRRFKMQRWLDSLATIFPFEPPHYADTTLPTQFVGHPFIDDQEKSFLRYDPAGKLLLLPGSRQAAISRIFPIMLATLQHLRAQIEPLEVVVIYPTEELKALLQRLLAQHAPDCAEIVRLTAHPQSDETLPVRAVLTSSGTMSFQCALAGIPGTLLYKAHPLTYQIGKRLVKVPYLGMANLILQKDFYPEFIQDAAQPAVLAAAVLAAWQEPEQIALTQQLTAELHQALSPPETSAGQWLAGELLSSRQS